jgi:hypothetical protein
MFWLAHPPSQHPRSSRALASILFKKSIRLKSENSTKWRVLAGPCYVFLLHDCAAKSYIGCLIYDNLHYNTKPLNSHHTNETLFQGYLVSIQRSVEA